MSGPADRIFGLPVYSDKWLGDYVLVPGTFQTVNEMRQQMVGNQGTFVVYGSTTTNSTVSNLTFNYDQYYPQTYQVVTTGFPGSPGPAVKEKKPESDMAWLKRRVAEVSWVPA